MRDVKDVELKLISELMKNSRRSDRELARALDISQPTTSRTIRKPKEGCIKEYTVIPRFSKLGMHLLGLTFIKLTKTLGPEQIGKVRETTRERLALSRFGIVMLERGMGLNCDGVIMCFYRNFGVLRTPKSYFGVSIRGIVRT